MASSGPLYPSTTVGTSWTYDGATLAATLAANNTLYAEFVVTNVATPSNPLILQDFGFAIPSTATITGIKVEIEHKASEAAKLADETVQLLDENSNLVGDNKADAADFWDTAVETFTYGSTVDKWSWTNLTPDKINNANFGVYIKTQIPLVGTNITASIDFVRVTVTYTESATVTNLPGTASGWNNSDSAKLDDTVYANSGTVVPKALGESPNSSPSDILSVSGFGFNVPAGTPINGIIATIDRYASIATSLEDINVQLLKNGVASGDNKAAVGTSWPTTAAAVTYGAADDTWNVALTSEDVNDPDFGLQIQLGNDHTVAGSIGYVDYISLTLLLGDNNSSSSESSTSSPSSESSNTISSSSTAVSATSESSSSSTLVSETSSSSIDAASSSSTLVDASSSSEEENVRVIQTISDGGKQVTIKVVRLNTEIGNDTGKIILDASELKRASGLGTERLTISDIIWTIHAPAGAKLVAKTLTLLWEGTPDKEIAVLYGSGKWTLRNIGLPSLVNNATAPTGNILLTTSRFTEADSYTLLLRCHKTAGYTY